MTRISVINYLNSTPFVHGIREHGLDLDPTLMFSYDYPANCAKSLLDGDADIALVPVAILPELGKYEIIGNTCIGSDGKVDTVLLVSNQPIENISTILLDYQSKTSVELCKILMRDFWKKDVEFSGASANYLYNLLPNQAAVVIGDRAFDASINFNYSYDLSESWKHLTGLPFVFALWISRTQIDSEIVEKLNRALTWGISNREEVISKLEMQYPTYYPIRNYLTHSISYEFDDLKRQGLTLFLGLMNK